MIILKNRCNFGLRHFILDRIKSIKIYKLGFIICLFGYLLYYCNNRYLTLYMHSVHTVYNMASNSISDIFYRLKTHKALIDENLSMKKQIQLLHANHNFLQSQNLELKLLKETLNIYDCLCDKKYLVRVFHAKGKSKELFITAGSDVGFTKNSVIYNQNGLIGKIDYMTQEYSKLVSFHDKSFRVPVKFANSNERGILFGGTEIKINYVKNKKDIHIGDKIYTSGDGNIFPEGIFVGYVSVITDTNILVDVKLEIDNIFAILYDLG